MPYEMFNPKRFNMVKYSSCSMISLYHIRSNKGVEGNTVYIYNVGEKISLSPI